MKLLLLLALVLSTAEAWLPRPPLGLDLHLPSPPENPLTREKVAQGRRLFFDTRLSRDGTLSCATCHDPESSFSDSQQLPRGLGGAEGTRNAPPLVNRGYGQVYFWDGRAPSLEELALEPIFNPIELGLSRSVLEQRTGLGASDVASALASYLRTIRSGASRFDRYAAGDVEALSPEEKDGLTVFRGQGGCVACHIGPAFSDEGFHNTGVAWDGQRLRDEGRFAVSSLERDRGAFKTPTLRDLTRTAPYMHDGSIPTLEAVVDFYSDGGRPNRHLDDAIQPRRLTPKQRRSLVALLKTFTGVVSHGL